MEGTLPGSDQPLALDAEVLAQLAGIGEPFALSAGEILFRQGMIADAFYMVKQGRLEIATRIPGDEIAVVSSIRPGGILGEFAVLDDGRRSATARAAEPSSGLRISRIRFEALLAAGSPRASTLVGALHRLVATRTRATLERIVAAANYDISSLREPGTGAAPHPVAPLQGIGGLPQWVGDLESVGSWLACPRGGRLVEAGESSANLFLVLRGALRAAIPRSAKLEQVAIHGPGELVGLVPILDGGSQPLLIEAAEEALLQAFDRAAFDELRTRQAPPAYGFLQAIGAQLVKDQRRANRHVGRIIALERFNAAGVTPDV